MKQLERKQGTNEKEGGKRVCLGKRTRYTFLETRMYLVKGRAEGLEKWKGTQCGHLCGQRGSH